MEGHGDSGGSADEVRDVQRALNALGTRVPLREDGVLDPRTEQAIRAFQANHGLAESGDVRAVQQALQALGCSLPRDGVDGRYGEETHRAVGRFQRDAGLAQTERLDGSTLGALARLAPGPERRLERNPEYDALFSDGRLDVTIAHGYYDEGAGQALAGSIERLRDGLGAQGFRPFDADRYRKTIRDAETGRRIEVVVQLVTPGSAPSPEHVRNKFRDALTEDEVVVYMGHARYGTGPDFDSISSGRGNFVIDRDGGPAGHPHEPLTTALRGAPETMLPGVGRPPGGYQLLYLQGCTTENYMENLRDGAKFRGRDVSNTDIVGTTIPMRIATAPEHVLGFVAMLCERRSIGSFVEEASSREAAFVRRLIEQGRETEIDGVDEAKARGAFFESGFAGNRANRVR